LIIQIGNIIIEFGAITEVLIIYLLTAFGFTISLGLPFVVYVFDKWYEYVLGILFMPFIVIITTIILMVKEIKNKKEKNKK